MAHQENKDASQTQQCDWCKKPMPFSRQTKSPVCLVCYKLLIIAGISEEEIYDKNKARRKAR